MLPESTTILIVGAGPTGLAAAISLINQGCRDIVIVDAVLQGENTSRAMAVHAATLESLETVGCADSLIELGIKGKGINLHDRHSPLITTDFSSLAPYTKYPFALILPQTITERVLGEQLQGLGVQVHRPYRLVGMKSNELDENAVDVTFDNGEVVKARYVIGADGARSTIRQLAGISFTDPDGVPPDEGVQQMVLADVLFSHENAQLPTDQVTAVTAADGFFLCIPLRPSFVHGGPSDESQGTVYRIGFSVPASSGSPPHSPPTEYLQSFVDKFGPTHLSSDPTVNPNPVSISKTIWATRFRNHAALADRFYTRFGTPSDGKKSNEIKSGGIILLVGDAAHIHSPAGGQGMNLGIRDAIGLGPAIAEHLKSSQSQTNAPNPNADKVLQEYALTRHARALTTIRLTKRILSVADVMRSAKVIDLPYWIIRFLGSIPAVRRMVVWRLSGLGNR